jgi:hypothetical protein
MQIEFTLKEYDLLLKGVNTRYNVLFVRASKSHELAKMFKQELHQLDELRTRLYRVLGIN